MLLRKDGTMLELRYEQSAEQSVFSTLYVLGMTGFGLFALFGGLWLLFVRLEAWPTALFFVGVAMFAASNVTEAVRVADRTTVFDTASRQVTLREVGWIDRRSGPVAFADISSLDSDVGFVGRRRAVIATLRFKDGTRWRLGDENIWVRP